MMRPYPAEAAGTMKMQLKLAIGDTLDTSLPHAYDKPLYEQKCSASFEQIYGSYPERDAGVYAANNDSLLASQLRSGALRRERGWSRLSGHGMCAAAVSVLRR